MTFKHFPLNLVIPPFESNLTDLILELDHLRKKRLFGSINPKIFFQLKHIFHTLESIGSARIEGNNTTIAEYIETKIDKSYSKNPSIIEIENMEKAMVFIEDVVKERKIDRLFISELHKIIVNDLLPPPDGEGDITPGVFRNQNVKILKSDFTPPDFTQVPSYMGELFSFINQDDPPKYDLLKTAIAHHRFVWVHPFSNGNGRTVRLLTYSMLVRQGFNVELDRILNPTAVFCVDRNRYYSFLSEADSGLDVGILKWCEYVLVGLKNEIEKIDKLLDQNYLNSKIIIPAIDYSVQQKYITSTEARILKKSINVDRQELQASDLKSIFPNKIPAAISREIAQLRKKKMLEKTNAKSRKYVINFSNNYLLRGIIKALDENDFLPLSE